MLVVVDISVTMVNVENVPVVRGQMLPPTSNMRLGTTITVLTMSWLPLMNLNLLLRCKELVSVNTVLISL